MPLVSFSSQINDDLAPIADLETDTFQEFVNFALANVLGQKTSSKAYTRVAAALELEVPVVQKCVIAISAVLVESAKKNASEDDFVLSTPDLQLTATNAACLHDAYAANRALLREYLSASAMQLPSYDSLSWRLDVEVSSRTVRESLQPSYLLDLRTHSAAPAAATAAAAAAGGKGNGVESLLLQADWATLQHVADELAAAVAQAKSVHARRILRYVK